MAIEPGLDESSRQPSPFCLMTVSRRGTSTVVLSLTCDFFKSFKSGVIPEGRNVLFDDEA